MSKGLIWELDIEKWQDISIESYQFVIEQAKERFDEVINESKAILSQGMKILLAYIAALSGLAGYVYAEHTAIKRSFAAIIVVSIAVIFCIYVFTLLFAMISSTRKYFKGSIPAEILYSEVFRDKTPLEGYKNMLYNETKRIQDKIQRMGSINRKHISQYRSILRVSLILVAVFIFAVFKKFFSGS